MKPIELGIIILGWVFAVSNVGAITGHEKVTLDVVVLDEGKPLQDATLSAGFEQYYGTRPGVVDTVLTDTNGCAHATGESSGDVAFSITKNGYYKHHESMKLLAQVNVGPVSTNITVGLKKMINPTQMYVKRENTNIPRENQKCGFDLEVGDWVSPYGKGVLADIIFSFDYTKGEGNDFTSCLTISFPNQLDGIQPMISKYPKFEGSDLRSNHLAPETGYEPSLIITRGIMDSVYFGFEPANKDHAGYYFRVRTIVDENGNVISAQYGKIYDDFVFGKHTDGDIGLSFLYYFNPDKTRNVEFDPKRNLFLKQPEGGYLPQGRAKVKYAITAP